MIYYSFFSSEEEEASKQADDIADESKAKLQ